MRRKLHVGIGLALVLLLLSACALSFPSDGLPGRGDPTALPENTVYYGVYGGDSIPWYVLDNSGGKLLLLSEYVLDTGVYDSVDGTAWAGSAMRAWLNSSFYDAAFSDVEKSALVGDDKVTLLTRAQAENAAYFGSDSVRTATVYGSGTNSIYWITDDAGSAMCVTDTGAIGSTNATNTYGIRPVIIVDADAIAVLVNNASLQTDGTLDQVQAPSLPFYTLALWDDTLPTISVSDYGVTEDSVLWIDCALSGALSADEKIYVYLTSESGGNDLVGWSSLVGGRLTYYIGGAFDDSYSVRLAVVSAPDDETSCYVGKDAALSGPIHMLNIYGIDEGGSYLTGQNLDFTAVGFDMSSDEPTEGEERWVPISWSADTQSGSWSGKPYTGSLSFDTPGAYTLEVVFQRQYYMEGTSSWLDDGGEGGTQTRSVAFTVAQALSLDVSPSSGSIYTGGRVTITPNIENGTWDFDGAFLSQDGNRFTGLKAGTTTVTYTVGAQSKDVTVTIRESELPDTGQDMTGGWILIGAALTIGAAGIFVRKRISSRAR